MENPIIPAPAIVTPWSNVESIGAFLAGATLGLDLATSTVYPSANTAIFVPFVAPERLTVAQLFAQNGAAVSGNVDVGIYSEDGALIVSAGSTAQAGTSALQTFNVTDVAIGPGYFFLAIVLSNTTGTFHAVAPNAEQLRLVGVYQMATALPLPATAVFASMAQAYIPNFGFTTKSVI